VVPQAPINPDGSCGSCAFIARVWPANEESCTARVSGKDVFAPGRRKAERRMTRSNGAEGVFDAMTMTPCHPTATPRHRATRRLVSSNSERYSTPDPTILRDDERPPHC